MMVSVGVIVDVAVGVDVLVGVNVTVGVGVSVANHALSGLLGPANQEISRITPPKTNTPARMYTIFGFRRCLRLRYELITSEDVGETGDLLFI